MAKNTGIMDGMVEGIKSAAETASHIAAEATGMGSEQKVYERIVPVPHADVYSEVPFGLVEKNGSAVDARGFAGPGHRET